MRFSDEEERLIDEFLEKNQMFDFSTLARLSILNFIKNPELKLNAVVSATEVKKATTATSKNVVQ